MRRFLAWIGAISLALTAASADARENPSEKVQKFMEDPAIFGSDLPAAAPRGFGRADTLNFGYYTTISGQKYAVADGIWTWDHGAPDPLEGWYGIDVSQNTGAYFKQITAANWGGHNNGVGAPIPNGAGAAWVGLYQDEADLLCWEAGLGYGNTWCQRLTSPQLTYNGSGDVSLTFTYFNDSEPDFDYTRAVLRLNDGTEVALNGLGYTGRIGIVPPAAPTYAPGAITIFEDRFAAQTGFRLVFEFTSDGGWSDEDASYATDYGPFAVDDVVVSGAVPSTSSYNFDASLQGWSATACAGFGSFFAVHNLSEYGPDFILDPCACDLSGNVIGFHNEQDGHPYGQRVLAFAPPVNKGALGSQYNVVLADWDQYSVQPRANGVFYRPGWNFYPFICPQTNNTQYSGRRGQDVWLSTGDDPNCFGNRNVATDWGVPGNCSLISFGFEVYASCDAFGIPSTTCTGQTNQTPLVDNVQVRITTAPNAPAIAFEPGTRYQDGYGQGLLLSTTNVGNADITYDLSRDTPDPDLLGDSLMVKGPVPTASTTWESKLWFRIRREGPSQVGISGYGTWKTAVADGRTIVGPTGQFTFGKMDSVQIGTQVTKNQFVSEFREDDDDFTTEGAANCEILRDALYAPGTMFQYFVTSNYVGNAENYLLPDTTGKNYLEFEILPSYRNVSGVNKFPCTLFIDTNSPGIQFAVEKGLNVVLNGASTTAPIPNPTTWDRYDYADASSNWNAPFARSVGGNNGTTLPQVLGYRCVILSTGSQTAGAMETQDFTLFSDWLSAIVCDGNTNRQGFLANGDNLSFLLTTLNPNFLVNNLGASHKCDAYNQALCGPSNPADESFCVQVNASSPSQFGTNPANGYDAWGNWCPQKFIFDVLNTVGGSGGLANRVYRDYDRGTPINTNYAQVVKSITSANSDNYRTVLDGVAYNHFSSRGSGSDECSSDTTRVVPAVANEIGAALTWIFGAGQFGGYCINPCTSPNVGDDDLFAGNGVGDRLYQNSPNPFNPRTTLRFSMATAGPAKLIIYDVNGRKVKTLVDASMTAGAHEVVWDGMDDFGHKVAAGVFWSQLSTNNYTSNKKMVVMR